MNHNSLSSFPSAETATGVRQQSEIARLMEQQEKALAMLDESISRIVDKTHAVRQPTPAATAAGVKGGYSGCALAEKIAAHTDSIQYFASRLDQTSYEIQL